MTTRAGEQVRRQAYQRPRSGWGSRGQAAQPRDAKRPGATYFWKRLSRLPVGSRAAPPPAAGSGAGAAPGPGAGSRPPQRPPAASDPQPRPAPRPRPPARRPSVRPRSRAGAGRWMAVAWADVIWAARPRLAAAASPDRERTGTRAGRGARRPRPQARGRGAGPAGHVTRAPPPAL